MENNINVWIAKSGYKKKWVAEQMEVSQTVLSRWINGHSNPSLKNALRLAALLECSVDELFAIKKEGN